MQGWGSAGEHREPFGCRPGGPAAHVAPSTLGPTGQIDGDGAVSFGGEQRQRAQGLPRAGSESLAVQQQHVGPAGEHEGSARRGAASRPLRDSDSAAGRGEQRADPPAGCRESRRGGLPIGDGGVTRHHSRPHRGVGRESGRAVAAGGGQQQERDTEQHGAQGQQRRAAAGHGGRRDVRGSDCRPAERPREPGARPRSAALGSAWLGKARLSSAALGRVRLRSAALGSACF